MSDFRGQIKGFPEEVVMAMEAHQVAQGNTRDVSVFEQGRSTCQMDGGFTWSLTEEGEAFWYDVIDNRNFDRFFERYPCRNSGSILNYLKWE